MIWPIAVNDSLQQGFIGAQLLYTWMFYLLYGRIESDTIIRSNL